MRIENTGIDGLVVDVRPLNKITGQHAFILGESWDYERVTYDYRIDSNEKNITYYIRVQGYALSGDVDSRNAVVKLLPPLLGKHYYPHGVEYGEEENFPESMVERAHTLLTGLANELKEIAHTE